ncbi:hypothetical protein EYZ11_006052 [Aspergillus tanneri]|uniref:Uncharacterized protein n=1 Tax=Aspergillus tanneri TaxID=1220188 RepID=A0A4S3JIS5_9EURO|nr:uncharacterized protein ATNIH1004_004786 [Aspergillus tanneri]KAA8648899.1 hypothetical protein ATNIH1004_004786 [Aspergillus tanneri]THC94487.1 hypothetical protein EYZ11_006052 [Aspergillus tanneri]
MAIPTAAIIVIVILACLAVVSLGAALTKQWNPQRPENRFTYQREQEQYMRSVRLMNLSRFHRESRARDVEVGYLETESGSRF